jgi:hypothetical protein
MPQDQIEILMQEVAILRGEIAQLHTMLEQMDESVRHLNVTLLERVKRLSRDGSEIGNATPVTPTVEYRCTRL